MQKKCDLNNGHVALQQKSTIVLQRNASCGHVVLQMLVKCACESRKSIFHHFRLPKRSASNDQYAALCERQFWWTSASRSNPTLPMGNITARNREKQAKHRGSPMQDPKKQFTRPLDLSSSTRYASALLLPVHRFVTSTRIGTPGSHWYVGQLVDKGTPESH